VVSIFFFTIAAFTATSNCAINPVFYKDWYAKGVTKVKHLMDDSGNFLSLPAFQNKCDLKVRPLVFNGLISAIKLLKRHIPQNTRSPLKYEGFLSKFLDKTKQTCIQETSIKNE